MLAIFEARTFELRIIARNKTLSSRSNEQKNNYKLITFHFHLIRSNSQIFSKEKHLNDQSSR